MLWAFRWNGYIMTCLLECFILVWSTLSHKYIINRVLGNQSLSNSNIDHDVIAFMNYGLDFLVISKFLQKSKHKPESFQNTTFRLCFRNHNWYLLWLCFYLQIQTQTRRRKEQKRSGLHEIVIALLWSKYYFTRNITLFVTNSMKVHVWDQNLNLFDKNVYIIFVMSSLACWYIRTNKL